MPEGPRADAAPTSPPPTCPGCGKVKREIRKGSLTSWIFSESRCQCDASEEERYLYAALMSGQPAEPPRSATQAHPRTASQEHSGKSAGEPSRSSRPAPSPEEEQSQSQELIGKVIGNHYKIIELIGVGRTSNVYKAHHLLLDRLVAIKYINRELVSDEVSLKRFHREAQAASNLKHPNICAVNEYGIDEQGRSFIVMDYIDGITLKKLLRRGGALEPQKAIKIICELCEAVSHAHSKGVIHRDIKPENIILSSDNDGIKLVDFGMVKLVDRNDGKAANLTKSKELLGTPFYMSPEQCLSKSVDARSDIYSMGCVLFEMLSGSRPFQGRSTVEVVHEQVNSAPPEVADNPPGMRQIVSRCLKKNPDERYETVQELLSAIKALTTSGGHEGSPRKQRKKPLQAVQFVDELYNNMPDWMRLTVFVALVIIILVLLGYKTLGLVGFVAL